MWITAEFIRMESKRRNKSYEDILKDEQSKQQR
jgi:hypothetical protein